MHINETGVGAGTFLYTFYGIIEGIAEDGSNVSIADDLPTLTVGMDVQVDIFSFASCMRSEKLMSRVLLPVLKISS